MSGYVCILCGSTAKPETHSHAAAHTVTCEVCGVYDIDSGAHAGFKDYTDWHFDQRYLISAMARTAPVRKTGRLRVTAEFLGQAYRGELRDMSFAERTGSILDWIEYESCKGQRSRYGAPVKVDPAKDYPIGWCRDERTSHNWSEWEFVFNPLLGKRLIEPHNTGVYKLTGKGWKHLENRPKASGSQGFVAIAFRPETDDAWKAIEAGILAAGYSALRIDKWEFIGGIMDEVQARIRESRFVVADLTLNRGGVYHEAGFALGLNIPVILTCRHDHLKGDEEKQIEKVHFDVQHLNLIDWTDGNLAELTRRVQNRIEAVIGPGPFKDRNV